MNSGSVFDKILIQASQWKRHIQLNIDEYENRRIHQISIGIF